MKDLLLGAVWKGLEGIGRGLEEFEGVWKNKFFLGFGF